jgi:hypothetical protein
MDTEENKEARLPNIIEILDEELNVAKLLDEDVLDAIGQQVVDDFDIDQKSMAEWLDSMSKGIKLASQTIERKNDPWPNASNVKHSIILEACIQFASRALPEFIRDGKIVKSKIIGDSNNKDLQERALRAEKFMNFELMDGIVNWEDGFDRLLMILAMVGTVFKKTYFCPVARKNKSVLCFPDTIVINQNVDSLEEARRITHIIKTQKSFVKANVIRGAFLDIDVTDSADNDTPDNDPSITLLEQHRYLDLDGDGYPEPYAVTVHKETSKVARIMPCFTPEGVEEVVEGEEFTVVNIEREMYFSDFHFIRTVDGTFFSYGFGYLLSHATHTINTILNQLIDAGTLDNQQSGFLGKGARLEGGEIKFKPGMWKKVNASGVDLKNSIVPLPTKGPSGTLLSLVQFLLDSYYKMISISDIMSGQVSGSNTTAAEAMQAVEQGMKVMNSIHARVYRGLKKEIKILFRLIYENPNQQYYKLVVDDQDADVEADFTPEGFDLIPTADPKKSSQMEEIMRIRMALDMVQIIPDIETRELGRRFLTALRFEDIDSIIPPVDPKAPTPEQEKFAQELQQQAEQLDLANREVSIKESELQLKAFKIEHEINKLVADTQLALSKAQKEGSDLQISAFEQQTKRIEAVSKYIQAITPEVGNGKPRASDRVEIPPSN